SGTASLWPQARDTASCTTNAAAKPAGQPLMHHFGIPPEIVDGLAFSTAPGRRAKLTVAGAWFDTAAPPKLTSSCGSGLRASPVPGEHGSDRESTHPDPAVPRATATQCASSSGWR